MRDGDVARSVAGWLLRAGVKEEGGEVPAEVDSAELDGMEGSVGPENAADGPSENAGMEERESANDEWQWTCGERVRMPVEEGDLQMGRSRMSGSTCDQRRNAGYGYVREENTAK